LYITF